MTARKTDISVMKGSIVHERVFGVVGGVTRRQALSHCRTMAQPVEVGRVRAQSSAAHVAAGWMRRLQERGFGRGYGVERGAERRERREGASIGQRILYWRLDRKEGVGDERTATSGPRPTSARWLPKEAEMKAAGLPPNPRILVR